MKKVLGLDLGTTTLGIAISDSLGIGAHPVETFRFDAGQYKKAIDRVLFLLEIENTNDIALGMPLYASGDISPHAENCLKFKDELLKAKPGLHIEMIDESYSTIEADERLKEVSNLSYEKRKKIIDEMAAVIILERYFQKFGGK